ncbi:hypothetical protein B0H15DRAFT_954748 [Mycena belliarum]|uniref:Uncharacterized protein n=1 Tax=Mycena belliarum TaxID=1033014 RepID=A0AAD6TUW9_9AGAR|nr:hypothetical protein B0H15DRAFT_954748 [Mycena belliae]
MLYQVRVRPPAMPSPSTHTPHAHATVAAHRTSACRSHTRPRRHPASLRCSSHRGAYLRDCPELARRKPSPVAFGCTLRERHRNNGADPPGFGSVRASCSSIFADGHTKLSSLGVASRSTPPTPPLACTHRRPPALRTQAARASSPANPLRVASARLACCQVMPNPPPPYLALTLPSARPPLRPAHSTDDISSKREQRRASVVEHTRRASEATTMYPCPLPGDAVPYASGEPLPDPQARRSRPPTIAARINRARCLRPLSTQSRTPHDGRPPLSAPSCVYRHVPGVRLRMLRKQEKRFPPSLIASDDLSRSPLRTVGSQPTFWFLRRCACAAGRESGRRFGTRCRVPTAARSQNPPLAVQVPAVQISDQEGIKGIE